MSHVQILLCLFCDEEMYVIYVRVVYHATIQLLIIVTIATAVSAADYNMLTTTFIFSLCNCDENSNCVVIAVVGVYRVRAHWTQRK